ncbi:IGHMBP2 family helicase [Gottschalkiaceae bacterium SANA]|nr:IGHMBP2 family helicase [Gottschalkiaceae bacterium SANA]
MRPEGKIYIQKQLKMIEAERAEEMRRQFDEMKELSGYEREKRGRALCKMKCRRAGRNATGASLMRFMKIESNTSIVETEIKVGDRVIISQGNVLDKRNASAIVDQVRRFDLTLAFEGRPKRFSNHLPLRLDLSANEVTYQRMKDAVESLRKPQNEGILKIVTGTRVMEKMGEPVEIHQPKLNKSQQDAVKRAMESQRFFLIQGPPGTGKSRTAVACMEEAIKHGERILMTADSNAAVDHLLDMALKHGVAGIRVGNPIRVHPHLIKETLDYKLMHHPWRTEIEPLRNQMVDLQEEQASLQRPNPRWTRGMSNEEIKAMAKTNRGSRGVSADQIQSMAKWLDVQEKIEPIFQLIKTVEANILQEVLGKAQVIFTTNSTAGAAILSKEQFDLWIQDEATQSAEAASLIPLRKAKRWILIGDQKQLPPTILSQEAKQLGMDQSLFDRLINQLKKNKARLDIQYRMNEELMALCNTRYYEGSLRAGEKNRAWRMDDLSHVKNWPREWTRVFFSVKGEEESRKGGTSFQNKKEAEAVESLVKGLLKMGVKAEEIGVIAPYLDQVKLLKRLIKEPKLEIHSVDAFQGREKEVILVSTVRSNNQGNLGFLTDERRLNVTITRAKRAFLMIGNPDTLRNHSAYVHLMSRLTQGQF